jgi:hypothetical protein
MTSRWATMNLPSGRPADATPRGVNERDSDEWFVALDSWVISDGNYDNFEVGSARRFALEFWTEGLAGSASGPRHVAALGENRLEIRGEVVHARGGLLMLDFGLLAYREERRPTAKHGDWLTGIVWLGVDPFFYFETYAHNDGVPAAIYSWEITGIWRQTAPRISVPMNVPAGTAMVRDPKQLGWVQLERTGAAPQDDISPEYLLRCRLQPVAPSRDIHQR